MKLTISTTAPEIIRAIHGDESFQSAELYPVESSGHKYKPGDVLRLVGLVDFPEHNGESVKITAIRKDGPNGKCYYIDGNLPLNWVYECRLEQI